MKICHKTFLKHWSLVLMKHWTNISNSTCNYRTCKPCFIFNFEKKGALELLEIIIVIIIYEFRLTICLIFQRIFLCLFCVLKKQNCCKKYYNFDDRHVFLTKICWLSISQKARGVEKSKLLSKIVGKQEKFQLEIRNWTGILHTGLKNHLYQCVTVDKWFKKVYVRKRLRNTDL